MGLICSKFSLTPYDCSYLDGDMVVAGFDIFSLRSEWYGGRKLDCVDNSLNKAELEDGEFDGTI